MSDPNVNDAGDTAVITVYPTTSPQDAETQDLVEQLRNDIVPATLDGEDARAFIGGQTAAFDDVAQRISERLPLFLLVVIGITFVLMSMAFRSIVVALKASITTLMSAFASFGILIAVFQWGWLQGLIGLDRTGPIESFLPVIVFAILFGLSMDYEVFLVSRIREEYVNGGEGASGDHPRHRRDRPGGRRGRADHVRRVPLVPAGRGPHHQGVRARARHGDPDRRVRHPARARARR